MSVQGLTYLDKFCSSDEETDVLHILGSLADHEWNTSLKRRTIHFGWTYPYSGQGGLVRAADIPDWCSTLQARLEQITGCKFDQVIVNEYKPGQGIGAHVDHPGYFGPCVVSVSLGSDAVMTFTNKKNTHMRHDLLLSRRSAVILKDDARYLWQHSIPSRKSDYGSQRPTRYSLTFRMRLDYGKLLAVKSAVAADVRLDTAAEDMPMPMFIGNPGALFPFAVF